MPATQQSQPSPPRVLVTGGAGFIGGNFIHHLITATDAEVANLDLLTYAGNLKNLEGIEEGGRYRFVKGDICDQALVDSLFEKENIDTLVHFAAESHVDRSIVGPDEFDPSLGYISMDAPMGKALLGKSLDDEFTLRLPEGEAEYVITEVSYDRIE